MYAIVKKYYDKGIYSKKDVAKFVKAGKITPEQYKKITGDTYDPALVADVDVSATI